MKRMIHPQDVNKLILLSFAVGLLCAFLLRRCDGAAEREATTGEVRSDTVIIRDTLRIPVPEPVVKVIVRRDTVRLPSPVALKDSTEVILPITRSTYRTEDYTAIVEGYRPKLISMELYPKTTTITNTVPYIRPARWALTVGPGVGYGANGVQPYIGVTLGFVLWSK